LIAAVVVMRSDLRLLVVLALFVGLPLCPSVAAAGEPAANDARVGSLEELMALFASSGGVRAQFRETRELAILAAPIETRGELFFAPPDRLARHTTHPGRSSVVVHGDRVALRDETGEQLLSLGSSEVARTLVGNTAALLRGDLAALRARYEIEFEARGASDSAQDADGGSWSLGLVPRSRVAKAIIARIQVEGRGRALRSMETRETSGDRSITRFLAVETDVEFSPEELARIFSLERPDETP
jgi:outer membrane lipoprotein-sorting protein